MAKISILYEDATDEIKRILAQADEDDWVADIVGKSKEPPKEKLPRRPKAERKPKRKKIKYPTAASLLSKGKTKDTGDQDFEKFIQWRSKSSPSARMIDHQISLALAHVDAKTDEIFDAIQDDTADNPPSGCEEEDAYRLRGFSEEEFRSELRKLIKKYEPAEESPKPTAWR